MEPSEILSIMTSRDFYNISVLFRLTPLRGKQREQCVVFLGYNTYQPSRFSYLATLSSMTQIALIGKWTAREDSHQAQKLAVSRQKLQFSTVTSLDCNFWLKIQRLFQNYVYRDRMLHVTKVNCFIFACLHPSSVKKLDVQNRNLFTYIRWRFISRITNITYIFHVTVGILLEVGALVDGPLANS